MRADPLPHKPANEKAFLGDNFTRQTGDFYGLQALTVHSLNAQKAGAEVHPQAAPSQVCHSTVNSHLKPFFCISKPDMLCIVANSSQLIAPSGILCSTLKTCTSYYFLLHLAW